MPEQQQPGQSDSAVTSNPAAASSPPAATPSPSSPASASAAAPQEPKARSVSAFFNSLFRGRGAEDAPDDEPAVSPGTPQEQDAAEPKDTQAKADAEPPKSKAEQLAEQLEALSDDDLAALKEKSPRFSREIQRETDRREAKRSREAREQQRAALEAKERELRETDPYEAAEVRNQLDAQREADERAAQEEAEREAAAKEQRERLGALIGATTRSYDAATLDPLMAALPETERTRILDGIGSGLDGRAQAVKDAIAALQKAAREEGARAAEKKLRGSEPFRKEVLMDERDEEDEPVLVASGASRGAAPLSMDDLLREDFARLRGIRRSR